MSRYNVENMVDAKIFEDGITGLPRSGMWAISYGFDNACGYFVQFFPVGDTACRVCETMTGEYNGCVDLDSMFSGLTGAKLGSILQKIEGVEQQTVDACFLDLPF